MGTLKMIKPIFRSSTLEVRCTKDLNSFSVYVEVDFHSTMTIKKLKSIVFQKMLLKNSKHQPDHFKVHDGHSIFSDSDNLESTMDIVYLTYAKILVRIKSDGLPITSQCKAFNAKDTIGDISNSVFKKQGKHSLKIVHFHLLNSTKILED